VSEQWVQGSRGAIAGAKGEPEGAARILRSTKFLADASEGAIQALARIARPRTYAAGQRVFQKGEASDALLAVVTGRLLISSPSSEGNEVIPNIIRPGELAGEIGVIDGGARTADAAAAEPKQALVLLRREFLPLLRSEPSLSQSFLNLLCARIRQTTGLVEDAILEALPARLLHRLQALAATCGRPGSSHGSIHIAHALSQQELGDTIGASRVSVNKQLNAWRAQGLLDFGRGFIVVHDMARFEAFARDEGTK
jgi:CRP-like cAMP-binding protein